MIDLFYPHLDSSFDYLAAGRELLRDLLHLGRWAILIVCPLILRVHALLRMIVLPSAWPGMVHFTENGPGTSCESCGHHLAAHDRATGRCCHGTSLDVIAVWIVLPLPRAVRALMQRDGCKCRLRPQGR